MNTLLRASLWLIAAGRIGAAQAERTATGCVVDAVTKQPLTRVTVTVLGRSASTVTDSLGFFVLRGIREVGDGPRSRPLVSRHDSIILVFTKSGLYTSNFEYVADSVRSPVQLVDVRLRSERLGLNLLPAVRSDTATAYARTNRPRWEALHRACVAAVQKTAQGT